MDKVEKIMLSTAIVTAVLMIPGLLYFLENKGILKSGTMEKLLKKPDEAEARQIRKVLSIAAGTAFTIILGLILVLGKNLDLDQRTHSVWPFRGQENFKIIKISTQNPARLEDGHVFLHGSGGKNNMLRRFQVLRLTMNMTD